MTIGNIAGVLAVSVLIVLSQAGDGRPPGSLPTTSAVSQVPRGAGSGMSPQDTEVAPPSVTSPNISATARPTEPPSTREKAPAAEAPARTPRASTQAEQSTAKGASPKESARPPEGAPRAETASAGEAAPAQTARPAAVVTLDLSSLERRLRETKAIGVFTKLSLKNQVDDLLGEFREFHRSRDQAMLGGLRQTYDLLLLKVLSLLQDDDPALAREISSSREALWNVLTDRDRFERL
ncbi:MAG: hypothetical protein ACRELZ_03240 [Candidatus Rokuibacteriota bacterium]